MASKIKPYEFKPGHPKVGGRQVGGPREKVGRAFVRAVQAEFDEFGAEAIAFSMTSHHHRRRERARWPSAFRITGARATTRRPYGATWSTAASALISSGIDVPAKTT